MTHAQIFDRRDVVARLVRGRADMIAVSGLGSATYDLAAAGDHERNFYLWGAMGGASLIGLGLALAQPGVPVAVICGDGEMLMGLGSFATIALQRPANLSIVVLDNGLYGETGGQPSHTSGSADLAAVARGCGIADAHVIGSEAEIDRLAVRINAVGKGPTVAIVKVDRAERTRVLPSRDGQWLKTRLRNALSLPSM